ncbi:MAG: type II toxin-antitoxin system PemK/MazF family toxin, partial [bacterium]
HPNRGEIWLADLDPVRGHEQGGHRPVLVISSTLYNEGAAGLVVVLPLTRTHRGIPLHILIRPPECGLKSQSVILCDAIRSVSKARLVRRWGIVSSATMKNIEDRIRILLEI